MRKKEYYLFKAKKAVKHNGKPVPPSLTLSESRQPLEQFLQTDTAGRLTKKAAKDYI